MLFFYVSCFNSADTKEKNNLKSKVLSIGKAVHIQTKPKNFHFISIMQPEKKHK